VVEARTNRDTVAGIVYVLPSLREARELAPVLSTDGAKRFVAASDVEMLVLVEKRSWVAEVGGVSVGVGTVHGRVLTLLRIGTDRGSVSGSDGAALLCRTDSGETFLIEGGSVDKVDRFFSDGDTCITWEGERIERLDVTALYRWLEKHLWERRWITREQLETKTPH
jgi:hypothetical protein